MLQPVASGRRRRGTVSETAPTRKLLQPETELQAFPCEDGPQLSPVLDLLHRVRGDELAFLTIHKKREGVFIDLASFRVDELVNPAQPWLPDLLAQLTKDAYVSVNNFYRPGVRVVTRSRERYVPAVVEGQRVEVLTTTTSTTVQRVNPRTGFRLAHRDTASLRWLNAAWCDCDGYTRGLDAEGTLAQLMRHWNAGDVPVPTFVLVSGRGVWPFWQLVDERNPPPGAPPVVLHGVTHTPTTPLRASGRMVRLLAAVNRALAERLLDCGADVAASDGARCVRVPGSWHSEARVRVQVLPVLDAPDFAMRAYTLSELAAFLGVLDAPTLPSRTASGTLSEAQQRQRLEARTTARYGKLLAGLLELERVRGGFEGPREGTRGCRNMAAFYVALAAARAGYAASHVEDTVRGVAARCHPPLGAAQARAIVADARRKAREPGRGPSYARLYRELGVTPAELAACPSLQPRARVRKRPATADERRRTIRLLVGAHPAVPSCRDMAALLKTHGLDVNPATVARDYKTLGLVAANARGGRPKPTLF